MPKKKFIKLEDLVKVRARIKKQGKKVVFTNGCLIFFIAVMCIFSKRQRNSGISLLSP